MAAYLNPLHLPLITFNGINLEVCLKILKGNTLHLSTMDPVLLISVIVNGAILYHVVKFLFSNVSLSLHLPALAPVANFSVQKQIPRFGFPHWLPAGQIYGGARFFLDSSSMLSEGYNAVSILS